MPKRVKEHDELDNAGAKRPRRNNNESDTKHPRRRDEFEIAIICALPLEVDAVNYLIDEFWPDDYHKVAGDPNHYSHGRIGKYNVVIVLLPDMGKVHAAGAASSLGASYTNLRLALLVGICGGVPRLKDGDEILLGDVVISDALVQFDFGRRYPQGRFLRENSLLDELPRPNKDIRASLKNLQTDRHRQSLEERTAELLSELQDIHSNRYLNQRQRDKYKYPGTKYDVLFSPQYRHEHRGPLISCCDGSMICDSATKASCEECGCDASHLIERDQLEFKRELELKDSTKVQEPAIRIGSIASGDTVMKSGEDRDRIAKEEGVIAFEMEGAGIWDEIPSIIVKGVCDYADSHKNKRWQNFAAATAAAAMKALLETLVATEKPLTELELKILATVRSVVGTSSVISLNEQTLSQIGLYIQRQLQGQIGGQVSLSPVCVIDARGCELIFHLETVSSKEIFTHILQERFSHIGTQKIELGEWCLEDQRGGQQLDLSQPWQTIIKPNQVLQMRMVFRRQKRGGTECPSCGFLNSGFSSDNIQCHRCGLSYRRVEEIQEVQISTPNKGHQAVLEDPGLKSNPTTQNYAIQNHFPRSGPARQTESEISRYKYVQLVDINIDIRTDETRRTNYSASSVTLDQLQDRLQDIERLPEGFPNFCSFPELKDSNVLPSTIGPRTPTHRPLMTLSSHLRLEPSPSTTPDIPLSQIQPVIEYSVFQYLTANYEDPWIPLNWN